MITMSSSSSGRIRTSGVHKNGGTIFNNVQNATKKGCSIHFDKY